MSTVAEALSTLEYEEAPYVITSDVFQRMVELGAFPSDSRVFLWDGRLYEKMAKSRPHAAVQNSFSAALSKRLPPGYFVGHENPVRLDEKHLPLPDLIIARGKSLDFFDTRYPDARDVVLVVEIAMTSLPADLGPRLSRYALTLPDALYVVADVRNRRVIVHANPQADGSYAERAVVGPEEMLRLRIDDMPLDPIPYEDVMR